MHRRRPSAEATYTLPCQMGATRLRALRPASIPPGDVPLLTHYMYAGHRLHRCTLCPVGWGHRDERRGAAQDPLHDDRVPLPERCECRGMLRECRKRSHSMYCARSHIQPSPSHPSTLPPALRMPLHVCRTLAARQGAQICSRSGQSMLRGHAPLALTPADPACSKDAISIQCMCA